MPGRFASLQSGASNGSIWRCWGDRWPHWPTQRADEWIKRDVSRAKGADSWTKRDVSRAKGADSWTKREVSRAKGEVSWTKRDVSRAKRDVSRARAADGVGLWGNRSAETAGRRHSFPGRAKARTTNEEPRTCGRECLTRRPRLALRAAFGSLTRSARLRSLRGRNQEPRTCGRGRYADI